MSAKQPCARKTLVEKRVAELVGPEDSDMEF